MHLLLLRPLLCLALLPAAFGAADNLIFNGGFELGAAGFEVNKNLRPDTNPTLVFEGAVIDTTTTASGAQSLKIPNRFAEFMELFARGVTLKPSTTYTLSVSLRTDVDRLSVRALVVPNDNKSSHSKEFFPGRTWQRFSFSFTTLPNRPVGDTTDTVATPGCAVWLRTNLTGLNESTGPANTLWVDDLQVVEGGSTTFGASAEVEAAVTVAKDLYVEGDGFVGTTLVVHNASARTVHGSVALRLEEEEGAPPRRIAAYDLTLAAGEVRSLAQSTLVDRFGSFTITPEVQFDATVDRLPAWFARVGRYVAQSAHVDLDTTFCISANDGLPMGYGPKGTLLARGASPDEFLALFVKMGGRMMRLWDSGNAVNWNSNELAQGVFTDDYSDLVVKKLYDHGIAPMPVLGGSWLTPIVVDAKHQLRHPQWLVDISTRVTEAVDTDGYQGFLVPDAYWRSHVARMVNRYKGKVTHWEIMNEPNIWMFPPNRLDAEGNVVGWDGGNAEHIAAQARQYVDYLRSAAEEIRAADPQARIVGFCPTGDMGSLSTVPFLRESITAGGLASADAVSFHPYGANLLGSPNPADTAIQAIRTVVDAGRLGTPLWNTEDYYLDGVTPSGDAEVVRPRHTAARVLLDLGEGVAQSCSVMDVSLWRKTLNPEFRNGARGRWAPSANFVAYNAIARYLEGARPVAGGKIAFTNEAICYVYQRRDGSYMAAFWTYRPTPDFEVKLTGPIAGAGVLDVFGNVVPTPGGSVTIGATPKYVLAPAGISAAAFIDALRAAPPPAVTCMPTGAKNVGDAVVLQAKVTPMAGRAITTVAFSIDGGVAGNGTYNAANGLWECRAIIAKAGRLTVTAMSTDSVGAKRSGSCSLAVGSLGTYGNGGQPWAVPVGGSVRIEAENFDEGGEGAAFHDLDGQKGYLHFRSGGSLHEVDVTPSGTDMNPDGTIKVSASGPYIYAIDGSQDVTRREWLRYTVKLPATGRYNLRLGASNSVGSGNDGVQRDKDKKVIEGSPIIPPRVLAFWNGAEVGSVAVLPQTSSWNDFQPFEATTTVDLPAGTGVLELAFDSWGVALNWFEIGPVPVAGNRPPVITTPPLTLVCAADGTAAVSLAATDPDGDALNWSIATPPTIGTATVSSTGRLTFVLPANHGSGNYCVVRVEDGKGGMATIRIDIEATRVNGAPEVIVDPVSAVVVAGSTLVLTAQASDPDGAVVSVRYFVNGIAIGVGTNRSSGWGVGWTPTDAGTYALTAEATDDKERTGTQSPAVTVKVLAKGTAFTVTDDCGTVAPPERVQTDSMHLTDNEGIKPFGDLTRMVPYYTGRVGTATWRVPNASALWFSYALTDGQPTSVKAEASSDGVVFTAVPVVGESVGLAAPWHVYDGGAVSLPAGTNYVRLTASAVGAAHNWDAALLWVQIDSIAGGGSATPVTLPANFKLSPASVAGQGGQFQIVFGPVMAGWTYTPEYCADLAVGNWLALSAFTETNNGTQRTITDLSATGVRRFYRIRATPAP